MYIVIVDLANPVRDFSPENRMKWAAIGKPDITCPFLSCCPCSSK